VIKSISGPLMYCRLFFLLPVLLASLCVHATVEVKIHVDDGYPPYSYREKGDVRGLYIDILNTAFTRMEGYSLIFEPVPWNRGKHLMQKGEGFGLMPTYFHAHDWPYLYPYSFPLYEETVLVICNSNVSSAEPLKWPQDFVGKTIGNMRGYDGWGGVEFRAMIEQKAISYHEVDSADLLLMMVASGRNDCILMERLAYQYHMTRLKRSGKYKSETHHRLFQAAVAGRDYGYIGYSEPGLATGQYPWQKEFRKALDGILYQMKKSGELEAITARYLQ